MYLQRSLMYEKFVKLMQIKFVNYDIILILSNNTSNNQHIRVRCDWEGIQYFVLMGELTCLY